jgi:hypothetical protein
LVEEKSSIGNGEKRSDAYVEEKKSCASLVAIRTYGQEVIYGSGFGNGEEFIHPFETPAEKSSGKELPYFMGC